MRSLLALSLALSLVACGGVGSLENAGGFDTGGAQDIGAARDAIAQGQVPPAEWITAEGLLSEHDVPTSGEPCSSPLCLRPATGIAKSLATGKLERWLHIGMSTGIDLATFERPPIDLVIAIDKSDAMQIDMAETTEAAARLVEQTRDDDRIAVLAFDDSVHVLHELAPMTDRAALATRIRALGASGSWDIDEALRASYARLETATAGRLRRVVVLSCGYPSIATDGSDLTSQLVTERGTAGIGITFVGVLLGWDANLAALLGRAHGANYYYLGDLERVKSVFDQDLDFVLTPVAYDLQIGVELAPGWSLARMYGIPGDGEGEAEEDGGYEVATAFFSRRRGSLVARLAASPEGGTIAGSTTLSYRPEPALGWATPEAQSSPIATGEPDGDGTYYGSYGVRKAVLLINQAEQMIEGCRQWHAGERAAARTTITALRDHLIAERPQLDAAIDPEIVLVEKLLANMQ